MSAASARTPASLARAITSTWLLLLASAVFAQTRAGDTIGADISTSTGSEPRTRFVRHDGARWIKLHFSSLVIAPGGFVRVTGDGGTSGMNLVAGDTQKVIADFWANALDGEVVQIESRLSSYAIDSYGAGSSAFVPETVHGTDDRRDRECFPGSYKYHLAEPAGRMLFQDSFGSFFFCTGELISGMNHFVTAAHCVDTQTEVDSVDVRFNYDATSCGAATIKSYDVHAGGTLLRTSSALDYSVLTLRDNVLDGHGASARHGYLEARGQRLDDGQPLWLPQHPAGQVKRITDTNCNVVSAVANETGYAANASMFHSCDTEGGSSGSPVMDLNNQMVAMHHTGYAPGTYNGAILLSAMIAEIAPVLPETHAGLRTEPTGGWTWYRIRETWFYTAGGQQRLGASFVNGSSVWVDSVAESTMSQMLDSAAKSGHWVAVNWQTETAWNDMRLWSN